MNGQHPILRIFGGLYLFFVLFTQPAAAGEIVGRVLWQPGGVPAAGSRVEARTLDDGERHSVEVDAEGNYRIGELSPDQRYYLLFYRFESPWMVYPDIRCAGLECKPAFAGLLQVGPGETRRADQDLPLPATLSGRVTDRVTGAPAEGARVLLEDRRNRRIFVADADAGGNYRFEPTAAGLPPGSYSLQAESRFGYLSHIHAGVDVGYNEISTVLRELATPLDLAPGSSRSLDLSLEPASFLRGKVVGLGGQPGSCSVRAFDDEGNIAGFTACDGNGEYRLEVAPGSWRVLIFRTGYAARWVGGDPCFGVFSDTKNCLKAPPVFHQVGPRETRDLGITQMIQGVRIGGQISRSAPASGFAYLDIYDSTGGLLLTSASYGIVHLTELPPGRYYLRARSQDAHGPRLFPNVPCDPGDCNPLLGEPVDLVAGQDRGDLDFALTEAPGRCAADEPCLADRRFRVKASWRDPLGQQGLGAPVYLSDDSLGITFFDPSNTEVFVKVLDACYPPFDHYWVLAAGLTDVGVRLEVEDTVTGRTASYERPLGQPFAPLFDFASFPCGAAESSAREAQPAPAVRAAAEAKPAPLAAANWPVVQERCFIEGYPEVSCLGYLGSFGDYRFEIEGEWKTREGKEGPTREAFVAGQGGEAVGLYFFNRSNVELFVKILDGCYINDHQWLLVAGLTDVGVDLSIRDRVAGREKIIHTEPGQAFAPSIDIEAFPCSSLSSP